MNDALVQLKIRIPPPPRHSIPRTQLARLVDDRLPDSRLVVLAAPAGYGKTTFLAQWARAADLPVAWLSLAEEDDDLERFLRLLASAWTGLQPQLREGKLGLLLEAKSPELDAARRAFIEAAIDTPGDTVFVLDDYHVITDDVVHEAFAYLIEHMRPAIHFMLAGRTVPPLPLGIYRAHGQLLELGTNDLRFSPDETGDFLTEVEGFDLDADELGALHSQLEGWPTGLQLIAHSFDRGLTSQDALTISGQQRYIADYLSADVLDRLDSDVQGFLLCTSLAGQVVRLAG